MEKVVFVEILDRKSRVVSRTKLDSLPAYIGRAYSNDVIIEDPFICPGHLKISCDQNGILQVEDMGSVNGLYRHGSRIREEKIPFSSELELKIGHTVIRLREADHEVPPAIYETSRKGFLYRIFLDREKAAGVFTASFGVLILSHFLGFYEKFTAAKFLSNFMILFFLFAVWSGIWAFINRIMTHNFNFISHLAVAGVASLGFFIFHTFNEYIFFTFPAGKIMDIEEMLGTSILVGMVLYAHLSVIASLKRSRRTLSSVFLAIGMFISFIVFNYIGSSEFSNRISFPSHLKPLNEQWLIKSSTDEFFMKVSKMKDDIDDMIDEKK